jgi:hypothetical protein
MIEKPFIQVCFKHYYDWKKANLVFGYKWLSNFLTGRTPNSTRPTWKGKYGNSSFKAIQEAIFPRKFDSIKVSIPHKLIFKFGMGFCLQTKSLDKIQKITSNVSYLRVYIVHNSTDSQILYDQTSIKIGPTSNDTFDYKIYRLFYDIFDNTIFEGKSCVDYRKLKDSYGDCNYKALKNYIFSSYGCYPPWIKQSDGEI